VGPCVATARFDDLHIFFVPFIRNATETACICTSCGERFTVDEGRYKSFVPSAEALTMPIETLIEETNPSLHEHLQWLQQQNQLADDSEFSSAAGAVERLPLGQVRTELVQDLQRWQQFDGRQRAALVKAAKESEDAFWFALTMTHRIPGSSGCLMGLMACLAVWGGFIGARAAGYLPGGVVSGFAGLVTGPLLAAVVAHRVQQRRIRRWVVEVFVPEGEGADVDFGRLAAILRDQPVAGPHSIDALHTLREHADLVIEVLRPRLSQRGIEHGSSS
jgi:hypothetical protein